MANDFTKQEQKTLTQIGVITKAFQSEINKLSQQEVEDIISVGQKLDPTNCGWQQYWIREALLRFASERLRGMVDQQTELAKMSNGEE